MKGLSGPKLLVVHPSSNKSPGSAGSPGAVLGAWRRVCAAVFLACFACVSLATTLLSAARDSGAVAGGGRAASAVFVVPVGGGRLATSAAGQEGLPGYMFDTLVQYSSAGGDVCAIAAVLKRRSP